MGSVEKGKPKTYFMETAASVASHVGHHASFRGHTQDWYKAIVGPVEKCPTCDIKPVFEEIREIREAEIG